MSFALWVCNPVREKKEKFPLLLFLNGLHTDAEIFYDLVDIDTFSKNKTKFL